MHGTKARIQTQITGRTNTVFTLRPAGTKQSLPVIQQHLSPRQWRPESGSPDLLPTQACGDQTLPLAVCYATGCCYATETGDGAGSATTAMVFLGPTAVSASLALGLRAEAEEAMWAVGCGGGALRRPGEVWYYVRRPSAIARRGGSGGGRRAGEVRATAAGRSAL